MCLMRTIQTLSFIALLFLSGTNCECFDVVDGIPRYNGNISVTRSNLSCQRWDTDYPHILFYRPSTPSENYCRNPSDEPFIWCYTTSPWKRWEICDIGNCSLASTEITRRQTHSPYSNSTMNNACSCPCNEINERKNFWYNYFNGNLTQREKDKIIEEEKQRIKEALFIDPMELSSYLRTKKSSVDNRPSAHFVGLVGGGFLCMIAAFIVLVDLFNYHMTRSKTSTKNK